MAAYQPFTSVRSVDPDPARLLSALRTAIDATIGVQHQPGSNAYVLKKSSDTAWTTPQIQAVQQILDAAPDFTETTGAESRIDAYPLEIRALLLVILDQINVLRTRAGLTAVTPAQAIQAIKDKLGSLPKPIALKVAAKGGKLNQAKPRTKR